MGNGERVKKMVSVYEIIDGKRVEQKENPHEIYINIFLILL